MNTSAAPAELSKPAPVQSVRSPVLNHFRLSPFRALRVPVTARAEEAVWKAEEIVSLQRAGLPASDPDPIPWLPGVEEFEIHQAVQVVEEPLRRLTEQMLFFDLVHDAHAAALQTTLASPTTERVAAYLGNRPELSAPPVRAPVVKPAAPQPAPQPATAAPQFSIMTCPACGARMIPKSDGSCPSCQYIVVSASSPPPSPPPASPSPAVVAEIVEPPPPPDAVTESLVRNIALAVNQANLRLLMAARALSWEATGSQPSTAKPAVPKVNWKESGGIRLTENIHDLITEQVADRSLRERLEKLWTEAVGSWHRLLASPDFGSYVVGAIRDLEDDLVNEDDVETVVGAVRSQVNDFLVGEVKLQIIDGRFDHVQALLAAVAKSGIAARDWTLAFRPLRQLFETEVRELESLVKDQQALRARDVEVYLERLSGLAARWKEIDRDNLLGLGQIIDERVRWAFNSLKQYVDLATIDELKPLFARSSLLASAPSLGQQIQAYVLSVVESTNWACFFCKKREADVDRSVVLKGQKETHRESIPGGTRIHYLIKHDLVPRCERCCQLHSFLFTLSIVAWVAFLPAVVQLLYYFWFRFHEGEWFGWTAGVVVTFVTIGFAARWIAAMNLTPRGEQAYYNASRSRGYQDLAREGFGITTDYGRDALATMKKAR